MELLILIVAIIQSFAQPQEDDGFDDLLKFVIIYHIAFGHQMQEHILKVAHLLCSDFAILYVSL